MSKLTNIRNIISKTLLMIIGSVLEVSVFWRYILQGFNLNTSAPIEWSSTDYVLCVIGFVFMVGAAYFNKIVDVLIKKIS